LPDKIVLESLRMRQITLAIQRQIERSKISIGEFEHALDSFASELISAEAVIPKVTRLDTDDLMLHALVCALADRN